MDIKEIEKAIAAIQNSIFKNSNAFSAGVLKSHFRGAGLQFKEHQVYMPGDDVRFIDWKLSARTSNVYVKTFEEDRNVEITVVLDVSPTMTYGSDGVSKLQVACEIICLLYLLAEKTQDVVRVIICTDQKIELPPKKGREGLTHFVSALQKNGLLHNGRIINDSRKHQIDHGIIHIVRRELSKRKEVMYLGDGSSLLNEKDYKRILADIRFHGVQILSPIDTERFKFSMTGKNKFTWLAPVNVNDNLNMGKKFLRLVTNERYLEKFVRNVT